MGIYYDQICKFYIGRNLCLSKFIRSVWTWLVGLVGKNNVFQGLEMSTLSELLITSIQVVLEFVFEYISNILFYLEKARDSLLCFLVDNNFFLLCWVFVVAWTTL